MAYDPAFSFKDLQAALADRRPTFAPPNPWVGFPDPTPCFSPVSVGMIAPENVNPYSPSPPGFIPPRASYYDVDWEKQSRDLDSSVLEARHYGQLGLHCHNLRMGTNLTFLGARKRSYTASSTQQVTFVAHDPVLGCTHTFDTHLYWRPYEHFLTVISATVPPAPDKEDGCRCFSILGDTDDSFKDDLPDWLPQDATSGPQFYEMKKSEVEQAKGWLHLYAQLALSSKLRCRYFQSGIELVKVTVQSTPDEKEPKKNMVKADNAIFYMSLKSSDGQGYNGIVKRTRVGRPGVARLSLKVKCSLM